MIVSTAQLTGRRGDSPATDSLNEDVDEAGQQTTPAATGTTRKTGDQPLTLAERVAEARQRVQWQNDPALLEALSDAELEAQRKQAERQRARVAKQADRDQRAAIERQDKAKTAEREMADETARDERWHARAKHRRHRLTSPDARLAQLAYRERLSNRFLLSLVVVGMVWGGINVQHNLVPSGDLADPLYWVSYGVEAMISGCLAMIMMATSTFTQFGREINRGSAIAMEIALLTLSIGLNSGPRFAAGDVTHGFEYLFPPVMVGVVLWLHGWLSARYAQLIGEIGAAGDTEPGRLGRDIAELLDHVRRANDAMRVGLLRPSEAQDGGGVPAAGKLAAFLNLSKPDAIEVRDAMKRLVTAPDQA
jgi:hypothetical protein